MHSKIPIPEKNVIPTTSEIEIDTTASSPSDSSSVITPNSKLQIHKWSRNTILIPGDSMISGSDEKRLSRKYPVKLWPFPGASADDMHHYLQPLLQKCPDTIILHTGINNCVNKSSRVLLHKILNLKTFIQTSLLQCKATISNVINKTDDGKASFTVENLNNHLNSLKLDIIDNSTIGKKFLGKISLYLTKRGTGKLAKNFIIKLEVHGGQPTVFMPQI